jgi:hypothetical protein
MKEQVKALMKVIIQMDNAIMTKEKEVNEYSDKIDAISKELEELTIQLKANIYDLQKQLAQ